MVVRYLSFQKLLQILTLKTSTPPSFNTISLHIENLKRKRAENDNWSHSSTNEINTLNKSQLQTKALNLSSSSTVKTNQSDKNRPFLLSQKPMIRRQVSSCPSKPGPMRKSENPQRIDTQLHSSTNVNDSLKVHFETY